MKYKPRPGIVMTTICDVRILVPSRLASDACKKTFYLPTLWAMTWSMLETGRSLEQIKNVHRILTKQPDDVIEARLDDFLQRLVQDGFLLEVEDDAPAPDA